MPAEPVTAHETLGVAAAPGGGRRARPAQTPPLRETPAPQVRGEPALRAGERGFLLLDRALGRVLPAALNPFLQTGAVAITSLIVAMATGVALLLWYSPSVHGAYASLTDLSRFGGGFVRSLHRYSSDAVMFFALVHALRLFCERRFVGAQWLAWVTGLVAVALLWFVGWTGYWLVWDVRAQHVATGTAHLIDMLPIFADPLGRAFLTDSGVNSFLFFVVFFLHMLVPLAMGIALWLHLARLARPHFLTKAPMTIWVVGSLVALSLAFPALNAGPAHMTALGQGFDMDVWYLLPIAIIDRLSIGAVWSITLIGGAVVMAVPWWMRRAPVEAARVDPIRCNACMQCYQDCPYEAIAMVPRTEGRARYELQAEVNPAKCVGCGICAGSCDSVGVGLDSFTETDGREQIERWLGESNGGGERPNILFACAHSAGGGLEIDAASGRCAELPGWRVLEVPCAGWIHPLTIELPLRRGAHEALVVTCPSETCHYREGVAWTQQRLDGERSPALRADKVERERIHVLALDRTRTGDLIETARRIAGGAGPAQAAPGRVSGWLAAAVLAIVVAAGLGASTAIGYRTPALPGSELVVTFKHAGIPGENCHVLTDEEKEKLPRHMRRDRICDRARAAVRLRVEVDGQPVVERSYAPAGIWGDGESVAVERIPMTPGEHDVRVAIGETSDPSEWKYTTSGREAFSSDARRVLTFDHLDGFTWH